MKYENIIERALFTEEFEEIYIFWTSVFRMLTSKLPDTFASITTGLINTLACKYVSNRI